MKKLVILILVIVLAFAGYLSWLSYQPEQHMAVTDESVPAYDGEMAEDPAMSEEAAELSVRGIDYEALKALYDEEQIVFKAYGKEYSWGEYYSWMKMNAKQIESYFQQMAMYYGVAGDWEASIGDDSGMIYAEMPAATTEDNLLRFAAIEKMAADKGVSLSENSLDQLEDEALAAAVMGEEASFEDFLAALDETGMSLESYKDVSEVNFLYSDILSAEFGENCEKVSDEEVGAWLSEQGYMAANHILFMTMDKATGEKADEASAAEKKAKAEEIYAELAAIGDVEERISRFRELKEEYDEDTGKISYPDGYTFTSGTMVSEFENAVKGLEVYDISEPVESSYGYHVILRMPLAKSNLLSDSSGNLVEAGWIYAQQKLGSEVEALMDTSAIEYAEGFEQPNLLNFIVEK